MSVPKRGLSILLASLLLVTAVPLNAIAATPVEIMPFWENANSASATLTISSSTATCSFRISGISGTTKITATVYLQRKPANGNYSTIKTWSGLSSNSTILTFSDTYSVSSGYTYRLQCDAVVTKDKYDEPVTVYSGEKVGQ